MPTRACATAAAAADSPGQRLRACHRRFERTGDRSPRPGSERATGDVVGRGYGSHFPAAWDIKEYAVKMFQNGGKGIGARGKDNGVLSRCRRRGSEGRNRGRLRPRGDITDGFAGSDDPGSDPARAPQRGNCGRGLVVGTTRIINRIADARGVNLQDVPRDAPRQQPQFHIPIGTIICILFIILMSTAGPQAPTTVSGARP